MITPNGGKNLFDRFQLLKPNKMKPGEVEMTKKLQAQKAEILSKCVVKGRIINAFTIFFEIIDIINTFYILKEERASYKKEIDEVIRYNNDSINC